MCLSACMLLACLQKVPPFRLAGRSERRYITSAIINVSICLTVLPCYLKVTILFCHICKVLCQIAGLTQLFGGKEKSLVNVREGDTSGRPPTCDGMQGLGVLDLPDAGLEGVRNSHGFLLSQQVSLHGFEAIAVRIFGAKSHGHKVLLQHTCRRQLLMRSQVQQKVGKLLSILHRVLL